MGSELSCPCAGKTIESENVPQPIAENQTVNIKSRFAEEDIIYNYSYGYTKLFLIKTSNLEKFFNCKAVLKLTNKREVNKSVRKVYFIKKDV